MCRGRSSARRATGQARDREECFAPLATSCEHIMRWQSRTAMKNSKSEASPRILPKGPPTLPVRGQCFAPYFISLLHSLHWAVCLLGCKKFLKSPSLVIRTSNVLHLVIGSCQGLRLAYDEFHLSIEIVYSDLPPAVSTSLNSKAELL